MKTKATPDKPEAQKSEKPVDGAAEKKTKVEQKSAEMVAALKFARNEAFQAGHKDKDDCIKG